MINYAMAFDLDLLHAYSDEDIEELVRRNPAMRFERTAEGRLLVSPPAGFASGRSNSTLVMRLGQWNERAGGGGCVLESSVGYHLPDSALFAPDASWLSAATFAALRAKQSLEGFAWICPDLVFEVVSHSDRLSRVRRKMELFVKNGAKCAVLIDPQERLVETSDSRGVHRAVPGPTLTVPVEFLPRALAPFEVDIAELFASA
ncbi:MAG: Uma2 family endonuclease [Candidatus Eremiobacteraeota bacterium]|nr:Uma2 family endonuclease [Candidatus Eremiobacteraeota bacterium]